MYPPHKNGARPHDLSVIFGEANTRDRLSGSEIMMQGCVTRGALLPRGPPQAWKPSCRRDDGGESTGSVQTAKRFAKLTVGLCDRRVSK